MKILWHSNYWDGPLNGVVENCGKRYWFDLKEENEVDFDEETGDWKDREWYRRFNVRKMPLWKYLYEHIVHYVFAFWMKLWNKIGYPISFKDGKMVNSLRKRIYYLFWKFYKPIDHSTDRIVGEFEI